MNVNIEHGVDILVNEMSRLNNYINTNGQIGKSTIIKGWHSWTNQDWANYLAAVYKGEEQGYFKLKDFVVQDIETLFDFLVKNDVYAEHLLYPDPTQQPPKALTTITVRGNSENVKTVVFRTMMNIREAYCPTVLGKRVPNENSSLGILDPDPKEALFEY